MKFAVSMFAIFYLNAWCVAWVVYYLAKQPAALGVISCAFAELALLWVTTIFLLKEMK